MPYMVTFEGELNFENRMRQSPVAAKTANAALLVGESAAATGCQNVAIQKLGEDKVSLRDFAVLYCSRSPRFSAI